MRETIEVYLARQAATIGRKVEQITRPLWVPHLPGAKGYCLGVIEGNCDDKVENSGRGIALLPDKRIMVTGNFGGQLHCYDLETGLTIWQNTDKDCSVINDIACSPQGNLLATGSKDSIVRIWDASTGKCLKRFKGHTDYVAKVSWSPDGRHLASASNDTSIRIWDINSAKYLLTLDVDHGEFSGPWAVDCSPDGKFVATGDSYRSDGSALVQIWNINTGEQVTLCENSGGIFTIQWSPDGKYVAFAGRSYDISVWNVDTRSQILNYKCHKDEVTCVAWSPDGYLLASTSRDGTIRIWDTRTGKELEQFYHSDTEVLRVVWSSDGAFIASSHLDDSFCLWDTRHLLPSQTVTTYNLNTTQPLPTYPSLLPTALAQMHRLGIYPPLSLVQDLLDLTGGHPVNNSLTQLAQDTSTGIPDLIALRWSAPARIGLVALLIHKIPFSDEWEPPSNISPREISAALQTALKGESIEPKAPEPPISPLREAGKLIDEKLLSLLTILGAKAVETEPALPLRLLSRVPDLPALSSLQRQLLGVRVCFGNRSGRSIGNAPGAERGQVSGVEASSKTDWISLLPSQLALPQPVVEYRHHRGELLFRTRELAEPPRLRPTVLLLDVTPPAFGPVEAITRIAAFAVANSLRQANIPVVLITNGEEQDRILQLDNPENLVEIWTERTLVPANEVRTLKLANAVRTNLKDESGQEPMILLLTQPWFGAEKNLPRVSGLRGLFIQYPNMEVTPSIAHLCERYETLAAGQTAELGQILGYLMG